MASKPQYLTMLRSLDPEQGLAYYVANKLGGPTVLEKVEVRMHKERVACLDLTADERAASQTWLTTRSTQRKR